MRFYLMVIIFFCCSVKILIGADPKLILNTNYSIGSNYWGGDFIIAPDSGQGSIFGMRGFMSPQPAKGEYNYFSLHWGYTNAVKPNIYLFYSPGVRWKSSVSEVGWGYTESVSLDFTFGVILINTSVRFNRFSGMIALSAASKDITFGIGVQANEVINLVKRILP